MFKMEDENSIHRKALNAEQLAFLNAQIDYLTGRVVQLQMALMKAEEKLANEQTEAVSD